jgi:hypothetical protein
MVDVSQNDRYLQGLEEGAHVASTSGSLDYIPAIFYPSTEWELGFYTGYWAIKGN